MQPSVKLTNLGMQITFENGNSPRTPSKSPDTNQRNPRGYYVYAHVDPAGEVFYIGKGVDRRAWSTDRHSLWVRYVEQHLNGQYTVEILDDNLGGDEAEVVEAEWINHYGSQLVNWVNTARGTDLEALEVFHERRNANRDLLRRARKAEKTNLKRTAKMYVDAIAAIPSYESIKTEGGLVGQLLDEEAEADGRYGEIEALDRLTMCLIKLGRVREAADRAEEYFTQYRGDSRRAAAGRIDRRIEKALAKLDRP